MDRKEHVEKLIGEGKNYVEIGKMLGISRQRVHQIHKGIRYDTYSNTSPDEKKSMLLEGLKKQL